MLSPRISVILPAYNAEEFIAEAIISILKQSYSDFELIIINDGSTDTTTQIISSFSNERIVLVNHSVNKGLIASLNEGISISKGEYIARMDADDVSYSERFKKQIEFMDKHPETGILGTSVTYFGKNVVRKNQVILTASEELKSRFLFSSPFNHPTVFIRKSVLDKFGFQYNQEYIHAEDYALWYHMLRKTEFANLNEALLYYRLTPQQISQNQKNAQYHSVMKMQKKILAEMLLEPSEKEWKIQQALYTEEYPIDQDFPEAVNEWLHKLKNANAATGLFNDKNFRKQLGKTWFLVCTTLASRGFKTQRIYSNSDLSSLYKIKADLWFKFQMKKWLK
ncbi:glycosyltransferase [soil metagenome]